MHVMIDNALMGSGVGVEQIFTSRLISSFFDGMKHWLPVEYNIDIWQMSQLGCDGTWQIWA